MSIKTVRVEFLKNSILYDTVEGIMDTNFNLVQHNSFILNKYILKDIFSIFLLAQKTKDEACSYERNFGLYFIAKNIKTINLYDFMIKKHMKRL